MDLCYAEDMPVAEELKREGANHTVYYNLASKKTSAVPRHVEVQDHLARKICKDLGISPPK